MKCENNDEWSEILKKYIFLLKKKLVFIQIKRILDIIKQFYELMKSINKLRTADLCHGSWFSRNWNRRVNTT